MSTDQPGGASPSDPAEPGGDTGTVPRFRAGVEQVDESTTGTATVGRERDQHDPPARRAQRPEDAAGASRGRRKGRVRARKVRRIVRHIEPWSVLKISVLFFLSLFVILCVASALLWNAARSAGTVDSVESFITSLGFGNCEDIEGDDAPTPTTTVAPDFGEVDQLDPETAPESTLPEPTDTSTLPDEDGDCAEGQVLVGGFEFEDQKIFQAFLLGGAVLVLAGSAGAVVMALLFNLISDLTGGVRVTVLEEEPPARPRAKAGSPPPGPRD
ncbi:MAG: DUF3566 domain-containing protein [Acidimicrobiales bacterium]